MFTVLSSRVGHCDSSLGLFDECILSANAERPPSLRQSQPTWAVSPPVGCYHLHPPSQFVIIIRPRQKFIKMGTRYDQERLLLLRVWHAPLGVRSAKRRHQSPEWTILSHSYRLIQ